MRYQEIFTYNPQKTLIVTIRDSKQFYKSDILIFGWRELLLVKNHYFLDKRSLKLEGTYHYTPKPVHNILCSQVNF